jgi:hypothetical protein
MPRKAVLKVLYPLKGDLSWSEKDQDYYYYTEDKKYKVRLIEVDSTLPFNPSTLPGLDIHYRQEKLNSIETGGTFDKRLVLPDAVAPYLQKTFGAGNFKYYLDQSNKLGLPNGPIDSPNTYHFEWHQPKTKQTVNTTQSKC